MNILVRNLAETITKERLMRLFQPFGTVSAVSIVADEATGRSRGFGFVEMPNQVEAEAAIKALHHTKVATMKIRVKESKPQFGPDYFAHQAQSSGAAAQPVTTLDTIKVHVPDTGSEQRNAGQSGGQIRRRQFSKYPSREGGRREFRPRSEGFRPRRPGEARPSSHYPSGEESRREFRPRGEGRYAQQRTGERGAASHGRYPYGGDKREFRPRGEGFRPRRPGEGGAHPPSRYQSREGAGRDFPPRGEKRYDSRRPAGRGAQQHTRYPGWERSGSGSGSGRKFQSRPPRTRFR